MITAGLLILTGGYVAAYWWPAITNRAPTGHGLSSIDRWSADLATWLQQHDALIAGLAGGIVLLVAGTRLWATPARPVATCRRPRRRTRTGARLPTGSRRRPARSTAAPPAVNEDVAAQYRIGDVRLRPSAPTEAVQRQPR